MNTSTRLLAPFAFAAALGCGGGATTQGGDLRQTTIPKDFTFQTTQALTVKVSADERVFGDLGDAQLLVSKPNGSTIFRGSIERGQTTDLRVLAPSAVRELTVTVSGRGGEASAVLAVGADGSAQGVVR